MIEVGDDEEGVVDDWCFYWIRESERIGRQDSARTDQSGGRTTETVITLGKVPTGISHSGQQNEDGKVEKSLWMCVGNPAMSAEGGSSGRRGGIWMTHVPRKRRIPGDLANKVSPINLTLLSHVHQAVSQYSERIIICIQYCSSCCEEQRRKDRHGFCPLMNS